MRNTFALLSFILVFTMALSLTGVQAGAQDLASTTPLEEVATDTDSYLLLLEMPDYEDVDIPAGMHREQAARQALSWANSQASPLLRQLEQLKNRGEISSYTFQRENFAISVQVPKDSGAVPAEMQELKGIQELMLFDDQAQACDAARLDQVQQQFFTLSQAKATPTRAAATDPSIEIYAPTGSDWTYFRGLTQPNIPVSYNHLRDGILVASGYTTSSSDGWYSFYPDWSGSCTGGGYTWQLKPGDVVQVAAHGNSISTTVVPLSAWADPAANLVVGVSAPYQAIEVEIDTPQMGSLCNWDYYTKTTTADGTGIFQVDFSGTVDFPNMADFQVYALDANANFTYLYGYPYSVFTEPGDEIRGYLKPDTAAVVTLTRASVVLETANPTTDFDGSFDVYLSTDLQPGDLLQASGGGASASYTMAPFSATSNPSTNQVSGVTSPGRPVELNIGKNYPYYYNSTIPTECSRISECKSLIADGSGAFSATTAFDLERADWVDAYIYDAGGNYQYEFYTVPAIAADPDQSEAYGSWSTGNTELTIDLMDAGNNVLETTNTYSYSWDNDFYTYFSTPMQPGYHIRVGDGVITETMTVQNVTAELNINTDRLTGSAAAGKLLGVLHDYDPTYDYFTDACSTKAHPGGGYNFDFTGEGVEAADTGQIWLTGSDGHYTAAISHAFYVYVAYTYGYVEGYVPTPNASVTVEWLTSGGSLLESHVWSAYSGGYFGDYLNSYPFLPGQRIRVTSGAYQSDIKLPNLTINKDVDQNRLYGLSISSTQNWVELRQRYKCNGTCWRSTELLASADEAGNYSASFTDQTYWDCTPAQVGNPCAQGRVIYIRPDENELVYWTLSPSAVSSDSYENDNSSAAAVAYNGPSHHTFHASDDVDWIKFSIAPVDVGTAFKLHTVGLGPTNDTVMELYSSDGTTLLLSNDDEAPEAYSSKILWTPSSAGTYYIKIMPSSTYNTTNCGAYYDFLITTHDLFLPAIVR